MIFPNFRCVCNWWIHFRPWCQHDHLLGTSRVGRNWPLDFSDLGCVRNWRACLQLWCQHFSLLNTSSISRSWKMDPSFCGNWGPRRREMDLLYCSRRGSRSRWFLRRGRRLSNWQICKVDVVLFLSDGCLQNWRLHNWCVHIRYPNIWCLDNWCLLNWQSCNDFVDIIALDARNLACGARNMVAVSAYGTSTGWIVPAEAASVRARSRSWRRDESSEGWIWWDRK